MYLSIPKGMIYEQKVINKVATDYFVDPTEKRPPIELQALVKEALRDNNRRKKVIELEEFTIYLKNPPHESEMYLKYTPNHNGKFATTCKTELIDGRSASAIYRSQPGCLWFQAAPLSKERLEEVLVARDEQRENRRHTGDSPCPT